MVAVQAMSPAVQAVFFGAAVVLFVLAALSVVFGRVNLIAAGLACFAFVFFWTALAAA